MIFAAFASLMPGSFFSSLLVAVLMSTSFELAGAWVVAPLAVLRAAAFGLALAALAAGCDAAALVPAARDGPAAAKHGDSQGEGSGSEFHDCFLHELE